MCIDCVVVLRYFIDPIPKYYITKSHIVLIAKRISNEPEPRPDCPVGTIRILP